MFSDNFNKFKIKFVLNYLQYLVNSARLRYIKKRKKKRKKFDKECN